MEKLGPAQHLPVKGASLSRDAILRTQNAPELLSPVILTHLSLMNCRRVHYSNDGVALKIDRWGRSLSLSLDGPLLTHRSKRSS